MSQLGRISGHLLKEDLLRNGRDLAFETDLLYLKVTKPGDTAQRVAINVPVLDIPSLTADLTVNGTTQTTNIEVNGQADLADVRISGNTIESTNVNGILNLVNGTGNQVNYQTKLVVDDISIEANIIATTAGNVNLEIRPNKTGGDPLLHGSLDIYADTNIYGNLTVSGNIETDGNIILGGGPGPDTVTFDAEVASDIIPDVDNTRQLGYGGSVFTSTTDFTLGDITVTVSGSGAFVMLSIPAAGPTWVNTLITHTFGKAYGLVLEGISTNYNVNTSGAWIGTNPKTVFTTNDGLVDGVYNVVSIRFDQKRWKDLWVQNLYADTIVAGDLVVDNINLALPPGNLYFVSTNGNNANLGEHQNDPFLTIEHALSVATSGDTIFIYPGTYLETFPLTVPVGVAIRGESIRAVNIEPTIATIDKDAFLLNGETTIEDITISNYRYDAVNDTGYAFRLATNFRVTTRSPYIRNVTVISRGSVTSSTDPYGFNSNDAGKGALVDGSVANALSKEASMLFHSVTFFTPNQEALTATNGARIEWLNCFTYFADKSMLLTSDTLGFASDGKTRVKITDTTGTWAVGNTLSYYDTDGTTVIASGVIESIDGDFYNIDTRVLGFEKITDRVGKTITVNGNAKLATAVKKFGTASLALDGTGDYLSIATQPDFAFPSTISRLAKTITVNGNAAVSATQSKFGGSSIAFDGTGDYLSLATDTDYGFGTGDFTIEGWFYKTAVATQYLFDTRTTLNENSIAVQSNGSGSLRLFVNGVFVLTSSNAHTNNAWNHLAISRASGVTRFFINGVVSTTTYTDATNYGTTKPLVVGAQYNGATAFAGYIDDFRVSNTARYTATFTPTTTAFTNNFNTKLLVHGDTDISDDAGGGTATDFTLEAWIYPTVTTYHSIFDFRSVSTEEAIYLGINLSDQVYLYVNGAVPITTAAISLNVWTHVAVVRHNATTKIYINGTQAGSSWTDITNYGTTKPLRIGAWYNALYGFTGYIDDVRITKGVARYTTTFSVPTAQLTGDLSTVLLITCNGLNNSTAIADNGITLQDLRTSAGGTASIIDFADYSDFGAEIRSIGSASVYGNYGVYGDGVGVIAYLIGQNLAYIGNGKSTTNDPNTVIQANEIVELNGAKIYYQSVDHKGDFRIGDLFYVNQETGEVTFSNSNVTIGTNLTFDNGLGNVTYIDASKIETGDFRISGNTIETLTQDFNIQSALNLINLQSNVTITGNLDVTGDVTIGGNITIGDQSTDTVSFVAGVDSDIVPNNPLGTPVYNLGTVSQQWLNLYSSQITIADVQIDTNVIRTTATDLTLQANGAGRIYIPLNDVQISQNLTVNGTTTLADTDIGTVGTPATVTHVGNVTQTGNLTQTGNIDLTGTLTTGSYAQFADIRIQSNELKTTLLNNDLTLGAAGTGRIYIPANDVQIDQNLTVTGYINVTTLDVDTTISSDIFSTGDILIDNNTIYTTLSNNNLILQAAGTGKIYVPSNDVQFDQNLTVNGTTNLKGTTIVGTVTHTGNVTQVGNVTQTGSTEITGTLTVGSTAQFQDIKIDTNIVRTTVGNNNLQLSAVGTGRIYVPTNDVTIENTLTVVGTSTTSTINNTGTVSSGTFTTSNISITSNNITSTVGDTNLVLEAAGAGKISVPSNNVQFDQGLTVNTNTNLKDTTIVGTVTHTGAVTQVGDLTQTGSTEITGTLTVGSTAQFQDIKVDLNVITTTIGNNNLVLEAAGTGRVIVPNDDVDVAQTLTVTGTTGTTTINNTGTVTSGTFTTGNISINGNTIQTTVGNSNLQLSAAGTGFIQLEQFDVQENEIRINTGSDLTLTPNGTGIVTVNSTQSIKIPVGDNAARPTGAAGMIRFNTDLTRYEGYNGTAWVRLDGVEDADGNTKITAELTPGANDNTIRFYADGTQVADLTSTRLNTNNITVGAINLNNNVVSTTTTNTDLLLSPNGTGQVRIGNFAFSSNIISNTVNNSITVISQTGDGYVKINSTGGFVIPVGRTDQRPSVYDTGMMRFNSTDQRVEIWNGTAWVGVAQGGAGGGVTQSEATDISILSAIIFG